MSELSDPFDVDAEEGASVSELARQAAALPGPVNIGLTYRDGEWSAAASWLEPEATFESGAPKPSTAHANGTTLAQALETLLAEATRIRAANEEQTP